MPGYRKLGLATDHRLAMLKNQVTSLFLNGKIQTTEARAKEVKNIAENLIALAVKEADNFTSKKTTISAAKLDSNGRKVTKSVTSKNGKKYDVVEREVKTDMVAVDNSSKLHARKLMARWLNRPRTAEGERVSLTNVLFNELAPKYKGRNGGYTRIYKLGPRRGDAAEMAILELV